MRIDPEDQAGDESFRPEQPRLQGQGTMDDPFRPDAFEEEIQAIAVLAQEREQYQYCSFEGSNFRIHPDGTVEWAHRMPPLRDNIAEIIGDALRKWREQIPGNCMFAGQYHSGLGAGRSPEIGKRDSSAAEISVDEVRP